MTYDEVIAAVLGYADRYDAEVSTTAPKWVPLVEGRINSVLSTRLSLKDIVIPVVSVDTTFPFPADLLFLKQVKLVNATGESIFQYISEFYFDKVLANGVSKPYYTVTNAAFKVPWSFLNDGTESLHVRYEQKVPPLGVLTDSNWLSDSNPQVYVFGLLVELYAFVKDSEAATLWDIRFKEELNNIENTDYRTQWSGTTSLQTKLG
jgi:hypothetical protein